MLQFYKPYQGYLSIKFLIMETLKINYLLIFGALLLLTVVSCGGNKIDNYISDSEKLVEKWKDKTASETPLSEDDKKELREDLLDLGKLQKELEANPDLVKDITPEQDKKITDFSMDLALIAMKAQ